MDFEILIDGQAVRCMVEGDSNDLIICVHGFSGNLHGPNDLFDRLTQKLLEEDFSVLRFNFRGTKQSDGQHRDVTIDSEVQDFKAVLGWIYSKRKEGVYRRVGIVGESLGGTITLLATPHWVDGVVLWYPAFVLRDTDFRQLLDTPARMEVKKNGFAEMWGVEVGEQFIQDIQEVDATDWLQRLKKPYLIIHGTGDKDVPFSQSKEAVRRAGNPSALVAIPGADHGFSRDGDDVVDHTVTFLWKTLKGTS